MIDTDVLLACLTLGDITELAHFEQPVFADPGQVGGRVAKDVETGVGSLPRDLFLGSAFAQALLFFVLVYFGAFALEAASSPSFPAPATVFSAFSRSRWTLLVLLLALWSPFIGSVLMAIASRQLWFALPSGLILVTVISVHRALQRRSYFAALNPRRGRERTRTEHPRDPETNEQAPENPGQTSTPKPPQ